MSQPITGIERKTDTMTPICFSLTLKHKNISPEAELGNKVLHQFRQKIFAISSIMFGKYYFYFLPPVPMAGARRRVWGDFNIIINIRHTF